MFNHFCRFREKIYHFLYTTQNICIHQSQFSTPEWNKGSHREWRDRKPPGWQHLYINLKMAKFLRMWEMKPSTLPTPHTHTMLPHQTNIAITCDQRIYTSITSRSSNANYLPITYQLFIASGFINMEYRKTRHIGNPVIWGTEGGKRHLESSLNKKRQLNWECIITTNPSPKKVKKER